MKSGWYSLAICCTAFLVSGYQLYKYSSENQQLILSNVIYRAEHRLLKDEISELERKPTYEQGYKDALIRSGGPQNSGNYQDGWDDAMKVAGEGHYSDGYHAAIQQFGYQKPKTRWLVAEQNE
jgi:hypothetical protein